MSNEAIRERNSGRDIKHRRRRKNMAENSLQTFCAIAGVRNLCNDPGGLIWEPRAYSPSTIDMVVAAAGGREVPLFCTERWPGPPKWCASARAGFVEAFYGRCGHPVVECAFNGDRLILLSAFCRDDGVTRLKVRNLGTKRVSSIPASSLTAYSPQHFAIATGLRNRDGSYQLIELPKLSK